MLYDDIINLPHHVSKNRPHMPLSERAAQFAPFAALSGHESAIRETARHTDEERTLDEDQNHLLDEQYRQLKEQQQEHPEAEITYFIPDRRKNGGTYKTIKGKICHIDEWKHIITFEEGPAIPLRYIIDIQR